MGEIRQLDVIGEKLKAEVRMVPPTYGDIAVAYRDGKAVGVIAFADQTGSLRLSDALDAKRLAVVIGVNAAVFSIDGKLVSKSIDIRKLKEENGEAYVVM